MSSDDTKQKGAVRKRQQISDSSRQMLMWVAGMSAVVGAALVVSWFVWQQIAAKQTIISEKNKTVEVLKANNEAAPILRDNIRALDTDTGLMASRASDKHRALQAILDALPAVNNPLALSASIENRLVQGINGLRLVSLMPTGGYSVSYGDEAAVGTDGATASDAGGASGAVVETSSTAEQVGFTMTVEADNVVALRDLLKRFERSIRVIDIDEIKFERSEDQYTMIINAHGYYQPAKVIQMTKKRIDL